MRLESADKLCIIAGAWYWNALAFSEVRKAQESRYEERFPVSQDHGSAE